MAYRRGRKSSRRSTRSGFSRGRSRFPRRGRVAARRGSGMRRRGNTVRIVIDQPRAALTPAETMLQSLFRTVGPRADGAGNAKPNGSKF